LFHTGDVFAILVMVTSQFYCCLCFLA